MPNPLTSEERAQILEVLEMLAAHCDDKDQDADPDDIPCIRCGKDALDTGWECTECGFDCRPYYYPQAMLRKATAQLARTADDARDARRYRWLREHVKPWEGFDAGYPYCEIDIYLRELENGSIEKVSIIGPRDAVGMASLDTAVDIARRVEPSDIGKDWGPTMQELASGESRLGYTAPPSSSDPGRNDSKGIEGDTWREET